MRSCLVTHQKMIENKFVSKNSIWAKQDLKDTFTNSISICKLNFNPKMYIKMFVFLGRAYSN